MNLSEYFRQKACDYWYEQSSSYGAIDFHNKIVVIVGGDCGTTALYALLRGAKHVISIEMDHNKVQLFKDQVCKDFDICDKVDAIEMEWKGDFYPDADIFLMDCEGCEKNLDLEKVKEKYEQYCIAVHEWASEVLHKFINHKLRYVTTDGKEMVFCNV